MTRISKSAHRFRAGQIGIACLLGLIHMGHAAATAAPKGAVAGPAVHSPATTTADAAASSKETPGNDPAQARNAARSRMRECGHQWSTMKKSGAANGMTWKDFSQSCLARQ